jgi:predicted HTH domain antitoxin
MGHTDPTQVITIRLELPASVPLSEQEAREILVLKLVEEGYLSQSEGARLLGISRAELIERMTQAKMAVARYTPEDLARETETLHWLQQQRAMSHRVLGVARDLAKTLNRLQQKGFGIFDYAQLVEGND